MGIIGTLSSLVAAIAAIATLCFTVRNSKRNMLRRIDKKEMRIRRINDQQIRMYGLNGRSTVITPLDEERSKLQSEVDELKRYI